MKNHFVIPYLGNKFTEMDKIYEVIKPILDDNLIEYIVEPYSGSCAFSVYISIKYPNKFKYIINDNNNLLYDIYNIFKDDKKIDDLINKLENLYDKIGNNKEEYDIFKNNNEDPLLNYIFYNKVYNITPYRFPKNKTINKDVFKKMKNSEFKKFIQNENITIKNIDGIEIYNTYKNNNKCLIFLDPPYIFSDNSSYFNPSFIIYQKLAEKNINMEKACIMLCLEKIPILDLTIFKNVYSIEYEKIYQITKKKTIHKIYINKQIDKKIQKIKNI